MPALGSRIGEFFHFVLPDGFPELLYKLFLLLLLYLALVKLLEGLLRDVVVALFLVALFQSVEKLLLRHDKLLVRVGLAGLGLVRELLHVYAHHELGELIVGVLLAGLINVNVSARRGTSTRSGADPRAKAPPIVLLVVDILLDKVPRLALGLRGPELVLLVLRLVLTLELRDGAVLAVPALRLRRAVIVDLALRGLLPVLPVLPVLGLSTLLLQAERPVDVLVPLAALGRRPPAVERVGVGLLPQVLDLLFDLPGAHARGGLLSAVLRELQVVP